MGMWKFIRRHKWLTTILSIVFIGLPQYIDSVWSLAERISGRGIAMPDIMWAYWITVPLGIAMFSVAIWAIKSDKVQDATKRTDETLIRIHKRTLAHKDKAFGQYRLTHNLKDFLNLHEAIKKAIGKNVELEVVEKGTKRKRLSKNIGRRRTQLDDLSDQVKPTLQIEWSLDTLKKLVNTMDRLAQAPTTTKRYKYKGLDTRINQDKKWNRLLDELQRIKAENNDTIIDRMINEYVDWVCAGNGYILWTDLIREYISPENLPSEYLGSEAYNPYIKVGNTITRLRSKIINRIKELQIEKTASNEGVGAIINVAPVVYNDRAKLEITNTGADATFTATARVVEGVPKPELYTMCWEPVATPQRLIQKGETASILVGEIAKNTVKNDNVELSVFKGGLTLFRLGSSGMESIGATTCEMVEQQKLNQRYPTMAVSLEDKCIIAVTLTATPQLLEPFENHTHYLVIDHEHDHKLLFTQVTEPMIDKEDSLI